MDMPCFVSRRRRSCIAILPLCGWLRPARMRSIVLFPAPDGPKSTVHDDIRLKSMRRSNVPTRCSISATRKVVSATPHLPSPSVNENERDKGNGEQQDSRVVRLAVAEILHLVV